MHCELVQVRHMFTTSVRARSLLCGRLSRKSNSINIKLVLAIRKWSVGCNSIRPNMLKLDFPLTVFFKLCKAFQSQQLEKTTQNPLAKYNMTIKASDVFWNDIRFLSRNSQNSTQNIGLAQPSISLRSLQLPVSGFALWYCIIHVCGGRHATYSLLQGHFVFADFPITNTSPEHSPGEGHLKPLSPRHVQPPFQVSSLSISLQSPQLWHHCVPHRLNEAGGLSLETVQFKVLWLLSLVLVRDLRRSSNEWCFGSTLTVC